MLVSAQVSLHPLRRDHLSPPIDEAQAAFRKHGLQVEPGPISTTVSGEIDSVFEALKDAFNEAGNSEETEMTVTFTNSSRSARNG